MPYTFAPAADPMAIPERQYATAGEVRFTAFTSCIGLLARNDDQLSAVHLALMSEDDTWFDHAAADVAVALLGEYSKVVVIGETTIWQDTPTVTDAYTYLLSQLNNPLLIDVDDGTYGGRITDQGVFETYQNGNYYPVP